MAKIKINKLPKGFKLVDGKVVEDQVMQDGGSLRSGDQADYGLVTTPQEYYGQTMFNNTNDESVRHSLSSVPRDEANIEAEGGETVLSDLNNNGDFGLYNITGPRHSQGGVPMFLPEQSFIYSDTPKLKFTKNEMAEFDMGGSKKTPAKISKKFGLNDFYGELNSQFSDNISSRSAELMLKKNMEDLSKLSFMQEAKKNFEDGVPLASHPFLVSQGLNPLEFTASVEQISMQQAQQNAIDKLPQEEQDQLRMLQQMISQSEQQEVMPPQNMQAPPIDSANQMQLAQANNDIMPMARFGNEMSDFLKRAQAGEEIVYETVDEEDARFRVLNTEPGTYFIPPTRLAEEGKYYLNKNTGQGYQFKDGEYVEIEQVTFDSEGKLVRPQRQEGLETEEETVGENNNASDTVMNLSDGSQVLTGNTNYQINGQPVDRAAYVDRMIRGNMHRNFDGEVSSEFIEGLSDDEIKMYGKALVNIEDYDVFDDKNRNTTGDLSITEEVFNETYSSVNNTQSEEVITEVNNNIEEIKQKPSSNNSGDPLSYFPVGSDTYNLIKQKQSQGFTFNVTDDGKLRYYKGPSSNFEGKKGNEDTTSIDIIGSSEIGDPIYSDDERGAGDVINSSDIGYFDYGMYADGKIPVKQYSTGNQDSWYGSDAYASDAAKEDWMRRNGKIAAKIEGFDYNKGKKDPQWLKFQNLYEEERKKFYKKVGAPYRSYFGSGETASKADGKAGTKVFNAPGFDVDFVAEQEGFIDLPKEPEKITTTEIENTPGPVKEVWRQDQNNLMALAAIQDDLYLPWSPKLDEQKIDYVLDDYTGKVNAIMGAQNTMVNALGAYGGPQAIARNNVQGKSLNAITQAQETTNRTNLQFMNRAASMDAQMKAQTDMRNKAIDKGLYDDTVLALQNKTNFDNEKIAKNNELFNAMITNASTTNNLNTLYPYYNINPQEDGDVEFTENGQQLYKSNQVDQQEAFLNAYTKLRKNLPADQKIDAAFLDRYLSLGNSSIPAIGTTKGQADMQQRGIPGYPGSNVQLKKGKEIKKLPKSFPFYSGKMGM